MCILTDVCWNRIDMIRLDYMRSYMLKVDSNDSMHLILPKMYNILSLQSKEQIRF